MRQFLIAVSLVPISSVGIAVYLVAENRQREAHLQSELAKAFDLSSMQPAAEAPRVLPSEPPVRESPAPLAESSLMPIRDAMGARPFISGLPMASRISLPPAPPSIAPPAQSQPAPSKPLSPMVKTFLARPAQFLVNKTFLGRPTAMAAFLRSRQRTASYVNHPIIRGVLDDPKAVRTILNQPSVTAAFLASPAMQDKKTVKALLQSPLLRDVMASRGVAEVMRTPGEMQKILTRPETINWLSRNPEAASAFAPR